MKRLLLQLFQPISAHFWLVAYCLIGAWGCSPLAKSPSPSTDRTTQRNQGQKQDCLLEFTKLRLCGQVASNERPFTVGKSHTLKLAFWEKDRGTIFGPYVDPGLQVHARLWMQMPSRSHGAGAISVSPARNSANEPWIGIYSVESVIFTMPPRGQDEWWEIHVDLKQADGTPVDQAFQVLWEDREV